MLPASSTPADEALLAKVAGQQAQIRWLELRVKDLETQLYGRKSEQRRGPTEENNLEWKEMLAQAQALAGVPPTESAKPEERANRAQKKSTIAKGPKPLDPSLPREVIKLPDPALKDLFCPVNKRPMQPGFVETLEVLARRPAVYYVQHYERTVFVSPAKSAPVYTAWPADVLPRSRVHASIVAHIAAEHFCEHQPYYAALGIIRPMPSAGLCRVSRGGRVPSV